MQSKCAIAILELSIDLELIYPNRGSVPLSLTSAPLTQRLHLAKNL